MNSPTTPRVLVNPISGEQVIIHTSARNSDGRCWAVEMIIPPFKGKTPAAHFHPHASERFEIVSGQARYMLAGQEFAAGPGDRIVVAPGRAHIHPWSTSAEGLHMHQRIELEQPDFLALEKFDAMLETIYALALQGKVDAAGRPNLLQFALILRDIQPEGYLAGVPIPVQHLLVGALAGIGRLFGYQARHTAPR
jgi:mannose-6-phosphate isomerase-like protein (cupin superfamily)